MAPFEALYGRKCRTPLNWIEPGERRYFGIDFVTKAEEQVWGVRPWIPMMDHMGCAPRGGLAHKTKPSGARCCSASPARHWEDILKIL